jgi:integrase
MFRSLEINSPVAYKPKPILQANQLYTLIYVMQGHPLFLFYRLAVLIGYMGMLRISNVTQVSLKQFDNTRHLARGDLKTSSNGIEIVLKWTKTLQSYGQGAIVVLPAIPCSPMCPLTAFHALNLKYPVHHSDPLFSHIHNNKLSMVTRSKIQNLLQLAAKKANLQNITFHALRRSAASAAFKSGVPLEQIQAQGCWSSQAIWSYIDPSAKAHILPQFFSHYFLSTPLGLGLVSKK